MTRRCILVAALAGAGVMMQAQRYTPPPFQAGHVDMVVSCQPEAQERFESGAALLHSFWYEEARKAFEQATDADPDCGMGYWGQAMTLTTPLWDPPSRAQLEQGLEIVKRAEAVGAPTAREKGYIEAVGLLYRGFPDLSQRTRMAKYRNRMARVYAENPTDKNAAAFYALSLLSPPPRMFADNLADLREARTVPAEHAYDDDLKAAGILEKKFGSAPDHPGAAHYLIHAYDNPVHAARGLPAADKYATIAPSVPHALHMPTHIYTRLGLWEKSARSNEAAWSVSKQAAGTTGMEGGHRDYHSAQWLLYAYLQQGRYQRAAEVLREVGTFASSGETDAVYHFADMSARYLLEHEDWTGVADLPKGGTFRHAEGTYWYAKGLAAARAAWPGAKPEEIEAAREAAGALDTLAAKEGRHDLAEVERLGVLAGIAAAQEERAEMALLLAQAGSLEDAITTPGQPSYPVVPLHELSGDLWFQVHRYADAQTAYAAALKRYPKRARSIYGLARSAAKAGDIATARRSFEEILAQWSGADADRHEIKEARDFLGSLTRDR